MPEPSDKKLYEKVRKEVYKMYKKPSAYRSGALVKKYKLQFSKKYGARKNPYLSSKKPTRTGLAQPAGEGRLFKTGRRLPTDKACYKKNTQNFFRIE